MPEPSKYPNRTSAKKARRSCLAAMCRLVSSQLRSSGEAVLSTVGADRRPHSCWMGTLGSPAADSILTITSPDSRKVVNILENPRVEWMFTDPQKRNVVYARGTIRIVHEPEAVLRFWKQIPDRSHAYFLRYQPAGMPFLLLETRLEELEYCTPAANLFVSYPINDVRRALRRQGARWPARRTGRRSRS